MCYCIIAMLLILSLPFSSIKVMAQQTAVVAGNPLVSNIRIEGFVLENKGQFVKLFRPYRNKHLAAADIDAIIQELQEIYEQAGYQGLISIEHHIVKRTLIFTIALVK